ncbi:MAG: molybdopterin molybdenumtransferase MoeA [Methanomicrobiales archaeon HGW-Methanomicrobiales-4]|nr:MAG: molybdopterin molybdenumtransferase MoeA [Methanomicrobiales archaeon HGW-Methanomicrobiales-4]
MNKPAADLIKLHFESHPDTVPVEEAVRIVRSIVHSTGTETIPLDEADERTLAETILAHSDIPGFPRSTRDGYAIIAADTCRASPDNPCILTLTGEIRKGPSGTDIIHPGQAISIQTGGVLPEGAEAVVMKEESGKCHDTLIIKKPVASGENIIRQDEDFRKNEPVYPEGWILRPQDIGVLASIGKTLVTVRKRPVIGIISTGRELVPSESVPKDGEVREVNSYLIAAFCRRQGAIPARYGIIRDDAEELRCLLMHASRECDAIIVSGGSARDHNDVTARVIRSLGEVYTESISFAPEKRTTIGRINTVLVIGLPGHPSSTFMVLALVVIHLIQALKGSPCQRIYRRQVRLSDHLHAHPDNDRYIRVRIQDDDAIPVFGKAGLMNMLAMSDGLVKIPAGSPGFQAGDQVEVMIW